MIILLSTGGKNGGGYEASKYAVIGFHGAILLIHAMINSLPISWLSLFGQLAAAWNFIGIKNLTGSLVFLAYVFFSSFFCLRLSVSQFFNES